MMSVQTLRRRFTVDEYHRMGQAGIFTEDDPVELLDGEIVQMTPIGSAHGGCVNRLTRLLVLATGERAVVTVQNPIGLGPSTEPQPDLVVARPRADMYARDHPRPVDIWLLVEVAATTVALDRSVKVPLYARAGIPEVWLVDLPGQAIEVYRRPSPDGYGEVSRLARGRRVECQVLPDVAFAVDDVLG